jgi:hypothetical protein
VPTSVNQEWNKGAASCGFTCNAGWEGNDCGTPSTTTYPGCDTPDIVLANGLVWAACNAGATKAYKGETLTDCQGSLTDCNLALRDSIGGLYQWGRNNNVAPQGTPTTTLAPAGTTADTVGHSNFIDAMG